MKEWRQYRLIDILDKIIDYRGKTPQKTDSGIPLITAKIIKDGRILPPNEFIAESNYDNWMVRGIPHEGDVVLTVEAPLGEVAQLGNEKIALAQRVVTLRGKEGVLDNTFLKYFLMSQVGQARLKARETGTTVTGIKQSELREVLIDCPDYEHQLQIASILRAIDNKIENNRKINDNLEQQAQAIYKSWFVDFEPFKDGNFVESELGLIPEGWEVRDIYKYTDVIYGAPYKSSLFSENKEGYPLIRIRDLKSFAPQFYTQEILPQTEYIIAGDVVAGMDAEFTPYIWQGEKGVLNQRCCKFKGQYPWVSNYYLLNLLKPELEYVQSYKTGTTVSHLGKADIDRFKVITPPESIVKTFSVIVNSLLEQKIKSAYEIRNLTSTRDSLLPKLMSGELKINEIDC